MFTGTRMTLDDLVAQLRAAHGDALQGVVLFGSTVADTGARAGHDVLVVVSAMDATTMRASGAIATAWADAGNATPLTLTATEWAASADVFAIEHADIADRHRVLHAAPGFAVPPVGTVRAEHVVHQLEYEVLSLVLRFRAGVAVAAGDVRAQRALLAREASRCVALMRAALRLDGGDASGDGPAVAVRFGQSAGLDPDPVVRAWKQGHGGDEIARQQIDAAIDGMHEALRRFHQWVDARRPRGDQ